MDIIAQARQFAETAHAGQTRKSAGQEPYVVHLEEVAELVTRFGGTETAIAAAWLHDTVEDCSVMPEQISARFGAQIAAVVMELTDDKSLSKPQRKQMQLVNAPGKSADAALVKLCDKMSNVRAVGETPPVHWPAERRAAYLSWAEEVVGLLPQVPTAARTAFAQTLARSRMLLSSAG